MAWAACRGTARLHYIPQSEGSCDASGGDAGYRNDLRADQAGPKSAPRSLKVRRDRAFIRRACPEKAMAQAIAGGVLAQDVQSRGGSFDAPADLILLVNSAAESIYAKELSDMFARIGHRDSINSNRPLLISITSESDSATGGWFPIGTFLPNLFPHRRYHRGTRYGTASHEVDQHEYLTKTPGNNSRVHAQGFTEAPPPDATSTTEVALRRNRERSMRRGNPAFEENLRHPHGTSFATSDPHNPNKFKWSKVTKIDSAYRNPYWILQVPDEIIHEHSPIFTPAGRAMMAALFRISNPEDAEGPRQMRLAQ